MTGACGGWLSSGRCQARQELDRAKMVASLPMRMGGLGLRSAGRCARAAYWASWADAIPMIGQRNPTVAHEVVASLSGDAALVEDCLAQPHECAQTLDREGFRWRPTWSELLAGFRPPDVAEGEPGEWQHGWQCWSSSVTDASFRKLTLLSGRTASSPAHWRSHSGRNAGVALAHCPTAPEFTIQPHLFRTLLLERLHLPLQIMEASCEGCQAPLDLLGFHRASCPRSGRVKRRATPTERMTARIFREAGGLKGNRSPGSRPSLLWRHAVGCGHHPPQRGQLLWRSSSTCSRP